MIAEVGSFGVFMSRLRQRQIGVYDLERELRRTANAVVYLAWHRGENRYFILKEMPVEENPRKLATLRREVEILKDLPVHPNLVRVYEVLVESQFVYLVMDYIEGKTLAEIIQEQGIGQLPILKLLREILVALKAVHEVGIIHCDVSPTNIIVGPDGVAVLADFGSAVSSSFVIDGVATGTPKYCAPERINLSHVKPGPAADLYSVGILVYEAILGADRFRRILRDVFQDMSPGNEADAWLRWHGDLTRQLPSLDAILSDQWSPRVVRLVDNLTAKDRSLRIQTAEAALRELEVIEKNELARMREESDIDSEEEYSEVKVDDLGLVWLKKAPVWLRKGVLYFQQPERAQRLWERLRVGGIAIFCLALTVLAILVVISRTQVTGFEVLIQDAPKGSRVYVDDVERTLPTLEGLHLLFLRPGTRNIRVFCEGYQDFHAAVSGRDGEKQRVVAVMKADVSVAAFPSEIDYTGKMLLIGAGEFIMGDDAGSENERPAHTEFLTDFYLDKYEVTNGQYKIFCDSANHSYPTDPWWHPKYFQSKPDFPVVGITFEDAKAYADWCGKRLPSESEWEKAASWKPDLAEKRIYPWGQESRSGLCNLVGEDLVAVGSFPAGSSAYGIEDLAGNAAEWTDSSYSPYSGNIVPDPGYSTGSRAVRGGAFRSDFFDVRTTRRFYRPPDFSATEKKERGWIIGFRCAVSANDPRLQLYLQKNEVKAVPEKPGFTHSQK